MSKKRQGMSRTKSARVFKRGAKNVHKKNNLTRPMRGGIRL